MNERDLDIAWLDAEIAFDEIVKQYAQTRRGDNGSRGGDGDNDLQGAEYQEVGAEAPPDGPAY
jgi:hypothetical protein